MRMLVAAVIVLGAFGALGAPGAPGARPGACGSATATEDAWLGGLAERVVAIWRPVSPRDRGPCPALRLFPSPASSLRG